MGVLKKYRKAHPNAPTQILSKFKVSLWKRILQINAMKAVNSTVKFLFCCLEMTRLRWIKIFFLTLGAPKKRVWRTVLCKYTEYDPKSAGVNLNQNESNGNFPFSWAWNNSLSWEGFWGGITGTFSARTTTAERFVFACELGETFTCGAIMSPLMWNQAGVWPSTSCNDCNNTDNEHGSLAITAIALEHGFFFLGGNPPTILMYSSWQHTCCFSVHTGCILSNQSLS